MVSWSMSETDAGDIFQAAVAALELRFGRRNQWPAGGRHDENEVIHDDGQAVP